MKRFDNEKLFINYVTQYGLNLYLGAGFSVYAYNENSETLPLAKICCCVHFNFPHPFDRDCRTCMCSSPCILIIVNFNRYGQKKL